MVHVYTLSVAINTTEHLNKSDVQKYLKPNTLWKYWLCCENYRYYLHRRSL